MSCCNFIAAALFFSCLNMLFVFTLLLLLQLLFCLLVVILEIIREEHPLYTKVFSSKLKYPIWDNINKILIYCGYIEQLRCVVAIPNHITLDNAIFKGLKHRESYVYTHSNSDIRVDYFRNSENFKQVEFKY